MLLLGLGVLPTLVGSPGPTAAAASLSGSMFGYAPGHVILWESDANLAKDLDAMKASGAKWVRVDFDWPSIQAKGSSSWNWGPTDRVVNAAKARGLSILAVPAYTPGWARASGTDDKYPPTNLDHYANFVKQAVARYAPQGVKHWEIWNEPNNQMFWHPKPNVATYTAMLKKAYAAVKSVDPSATVISAGLSPAPDSGDGSMVSPPTFVKQMYANGVKGSFDALAHHPYVFPYAPLTQGDWNAFTQSKTIYSTMQANGDGAKKIWATEFSWPTGKTSQSVDEATQAVRLEQAIDAWTSWSFHGPMFWYSIRDYGTNANDVWQMVGLLRYDFSKKPAYDTLVRILGSAPTTTTTAAPTTTTTAPKTTTTTVAPTTTTTAPKTTTTTVAPTTTTTAPKTTTTTVAPTTTTVPAPKPTPSPGLPKLVPASGSVKEGNYPSRPRLQIPVYLSAPSTKTVKVRYETFSYPPDYSATPSVDYRSTSGSLTFLPGQTVKYVTVLVNGDATKERDEKVLIGFSNLTNATLGGYGVGLGVIVNDD